MTIDIDLSEDFADDYGDEFGDSASNILPPVEELYGSNALPGDIDLDAMIATAVDPETPVPEGDLVPDSLGEDVGADDVLFGEDEAALLDDHSLDSTFDNYDTSDASDEAPPLDTDADVDLDGGSLDVDTEGGF